MSSKRTSRSGQGSISYKKLWHLLLVRDIKRLEFEKMTGIKHYTYRKMVNKEDVTTDTLRRICFALNVSVDDILDFIPDEENETLPASGNR